MDPGNIVVLDQKVREDLETRERDPNLAALLERLKQEDTLFNHNVPSSLRRSSTDQELYHWLEKTYSAPAFIVDSTEYVKDHLQVHDRVLLKDDFVEYEWQIGKYDEVNVIRRAKFGEEVFVRVKNGATAQILPNLKGSFTVIGGTWMGFYEKKSQPYSAATNDGLSKGDRLKYGGNELLEKIKFKIPAGTDGIVNNMYNCSYEGKRARITWGLTQGIAGEANFLNNKGFSMKDLTLVRPNFIDYKKLCEQVYGDKSR